MSSIILPEPRKVSVSIPDVTRFSNLPNPSRRTMTLGSTQPLREMSVRNLIEGKERKARKTENLTAICEPTVYNMLKPRRFSTLWPSTACNTDSFNLFLLLISNYLHISTSQSHITLSSSLCSLLGQSKLSYKSQLSINLFPLCTWSDIFGG
jgi:hypothetical protein